LARQIIKSGWEKIEQGANPVLLRKELEKAAEKIEESLKDGVSEVKDREQAVQIASVSVQDKELGEKIGGMMFDIGKGGAVAIKNSIKRGVFVEKDAGMRVEGALTGGIVDSEDRWETKLENARVIILKDSPEDHEFESKWLPLMRQLVEGELGPDGKVKINKINVPMLLVVAEKLSRRFIMSMNQNKHLVKWVWFRPTTAMKNMKEIYKDLRVLVGGAVVDEEDGIFLSRYTVDMLGTAESVVVGRNEAVITVSEEKLNSDEYLDRVNEVKGQVENAEDEEEQDQIKERLANLTGGIAAIKVAAATDQDTLELKLRIEDAINATRVSMEEGYVAGGGIALYNATRHESTDGEKVLKEACKSVAIQILHNAGYEKPEDVLKKLKEGEGINVLTGKTVNMKKEGIIDPLKVVRMALLHAVSVAGLLLTSEYVIANEEDEIETVKKFFKS